MLLSSFQALKDIEILEQVSQHALPKVTSELLQNQTGSYPFEINICITLMHVISGDVKVSIFPISFSVTKSSP